jgi:hypothetical protein
MSHPERCTSVAVRAKHRRLGERLEDCEDVVATDLLAPKEDPSGMWTTEVTLIPRWASVPSHVLEAIADEDLGIADVSPQGRPSHLVIMVR